MLIIGICLAIGSALAESWVDVLRKLNASRFDAMIASWSLHAFTFLVALPLTLALNGFSSRLPAGAQFLAHGFPVSFTFWSALACSLVLNAVATYLYMSVLATAELSLVLPLVTLSPVFLLLTAPLILGEYPSLLGIAGILVTTAGTYGLKYEDRAQGFWKPFTNLWRDRRYRRMIGVAFLWALSSTFDKRAVLNGGALWYTTLINVCLALVFTPFLFRERRWARIWKDRGYLRLLPFGLVSAARSGLQFTAIGFLLVPYAIGLKRLSVLFGIVWGRLLFGEQRTRQRLIAASFMLAGSVLILIALLGHP